MGRNELVLSRTREKTGGFAFLEVLFVLAIVALLFQAHPSLWFRLIAELDVRNWSRAAWIRLNIGVIVALIGFRYRPVLRIPLLVVVATMRSSPTAVDISNQVGDDKSDREARTRRDTEWRERARRRLPFT